jgi:cell division protein FtsB
MHNETKSIKSDDTEISQKTGEDIFSIDKNEPTTRIVTNDDEDDNKADTKNGDFENNASPAEISRKKYYDSEKKKNDAKTAIFSILKYLIPIFFSLVVGLLAIFGGIWAYKLNNIAEPIGSIKTEIENLKSNNNIFRSDIEKLEDRINRYLEKNIK